MIVWILKNWKIFLDALLIIAAIVLFTLWDPIGMFTNSKTKATANLVTGVRDIGQLVTAEYYGEVISSWKEYQLTEFPEDTLQDYANSKLVSLKYDLDRILTKKSEKFKLAPQVFQKDELYGEFMAFMAIHYWNKKLFWVYDEKEERLKKGWEEKVLKKMLTLIQREKRSLAKRYADDAAKQRLYLADYLDETPEYLQKFYDFRQHLVGEQLAKRGTKNKNIVFIGRGSVKAGFDFGKLDESNFLYEEEMKTVHFYGIKPQVLDADINPWFIPERKVKGFELVDYSGKVNFEDAKQVKKQCKEKLLAQARKAEIIKHAEENGREALQSFFSLLLDEPELKVSFHTHPYDHHLAIISADSIVDIGEALFIDSIYNQEMKLISAMDSPSKESKKKKLLQSFIVNLKSLGFYSKSDPFNYYALPVSTILNDSFRVDLTDIQHLTSIRGQVELTADKRSVMNQVSMDHSMWFTTTDFRSDFNVALKIVEESADSLPGLYSRNKALFVAADSIAINDTLMVNGQEHISYYLKDSIEKYHYRLHDLAFRLKTLETDSVGLPIDSLLQAQVLVEDSLLQVVNGKKARRDKALQPLHSLTDGVNTFLQKIKKK